MADVGKLSSSKLSIYKGCSLAYYLQYVQHEQVSRNVRLFFGKSIHFMLDRFYDINYKSAESFVKYWKFYWGRNIAGDFLKGKEKNNLKVQEFVVNERKNSFLEVGNHVYLGNDPVGIFFGYMGLGGSILRRFYNRHKPKPPPIEKEKPFGVRKKDPLNINGHLIRGVFDRIDKINGDWFIADYKTDKSSPKEDSFVLHRNPQFTLYSFAFRKLFDAKEKAILYYHLRSGNVLKTHRSEKDYDYLKKLLDEVSEGIDKDVFVPFYGFHCSFCDYKTACEKYSIPHHGGPRIDLEGKIICAERFEDWDNEVPDWIEMQSEER